MGQPIFRSSTYKEDLGPVGCFLRQPDQLAQNFLNKTGTIP
jgi:hypothetical protein